MFGAASKPADGLGDASVEARLVQRGLKIPQARFRRVLIKKEFC
jgi:hypothetical protein